MKRTATTALVLLLGLASSAQASSRPQQTPGKVRVLGGYAILAFMTAPLTSVPHGADSSSAVGRVSRCPRNADGKYRCTFHLKWRMRDTGVTGFCWANVLLTRHDWYFPPGLTSCPVDWLP